MTTQSPYLANQSQRSLLVGLSHATLLNDCLTHTRVIRVISYWNCIYITKLQFTNSMTHIMKQD